MKRVTLFAGHYGSGKTNVAINYALHLKSMGLPVKVADLDIVNPYFRTKDSMADLDAAGIPLICSEYAGSNVDFPALPGDVYSLFDNKDSYAVMDIGGDDRGAYALGRYRDAILSEDNYDMLLVINRYRPLTKTPELCYEVANEISAASGIPFTGIVNNSNIGGETTWDDVVASFSYAEEVSALLGLPIVMTTAMEKIAKDDAFPLKLQKKIFEEDS